jgi:hypothetical protein
MNNLNEIIDYLLNENELLKQLFESMKEMIESLELLKDKLIDVTNDCKCSQIKNNQNQQQFINDLILKSAQIRHQNPIEDKLLVFNRINDYLIQIKDLNKSETKLITINNFINSRKLSKSKIKAKIKVKNELIEGSFDENESELSDNKKNSKNRIKSRRGLKWIN